MDSQSGSWKGRQVRGEKSAVERLESEAAAMEERLVSLRRQLESDRKKRENNKVHILIIAPVSYNSYCFKHLRLQARFACLRCAAGGHFVSAGGSLRSPGITLVNYKGDL